jgi:tRNA (adenine22-N1)-methyltransferase
MKLSERLSRVAQQVLPGRPMADVGTDHGQLPVWLVVTGVVPSAVAMDLREGPLSVARRQVAAAGVGERVDCRLSDGLAALRPGEVDTVTICGMGGGLMARILSAHPEVRQGTRRLVLQPNSDADVLRAALAALSWEIREEDLLIEGRYIYPTIAAEQSAVFPRYSDEDIAFGPILRQRRSPAFIELLQRQAAHIRRVLAQCRDSPEATARFTAELARVEAELG